MEILELLVCPICKSEVKRIDSKIECSKCERIYKFIDGIPIMVDLEKLPDHLAKQVDYFIEDKITKNETYKLDAWQRSYVKRFLDSFGDVKGKTIIDCGAGVGYMTIELAKMGAHVIACDLTLVIMKRLKKIVNEHGLDNNVTLICCSAEELPIKDNVADFLISNAVLEHLPREEEAIKEIKRVCSKTSGVMIVVPLRLSLTNPLFLALNIYHDRKIGHLRRYDELNIKSKFSEYIVKKSYYTGHIRKVISVVVNRILPIFNEVLAEEKDEKYQDKLKGGSNICTILSRESVEIFDKKAHEYLCLKCGRSEFNEDQDLIKCICGQKYKKSYGVPILSLKEDLSIYYDY